MENHQLRKWIYVLCGVLLFFGCKSDRNKEATDDKSALIGVSGLERLPDNEAGEIVKKAIDKAGGWDNWSTIKSLSCTKTVQFFDSLGTPTKELSQFHQYLLQPSIKIKISWKEDGDEYTILNNGEQVWKLKNGQQLTEKSDINQAWNSSFGSHYVTCMPFKLTDHGTILSYEGLDTLKNGEIVHSVKTTYEKGAGSAAEMHTWWYYFDSESYQLVGNLLDYGDGYSYVQYEAFSTTKRVKLNIERHGYRSNGDRDLKHKRSVYKNENMQFNVDLDDVLFEPTM